MFAGYDFILHIQITNRYILFLNRYTFPGGTFSLRGYTFPRTSVQVEGVSARQGSVGEHQVSKGVGACRTSVGGDLSRRKGASRQGSVGCVGEQRVSKGVGELQPYDQTSYSKHNVVVSHPGFYPRWMFVGSKI